MSCSPHVDHLTKQRINKIVVLSHIGLKEDVKLAGQTSGVDAIVGGHSHRLLSMSYREAKNIYPLKVPGKDGKPVYIVQAGGGDNRSVGKLDLEFDAAGNVTKAGGDTILLSKYISCHPQANRACGAVRRSGHSEERGQSLSGVMRIL